MSRAVLERFSLFIVFFCVFHCQNLLAREEVIFSGKLVRKYYDDHCPPSMKNSAFGWFLELDHSSQSRLKMMFESLDEESKELYSEFGFMLSLVQVCLAQSRDRELCRCFENRQVIGRGDLPNPPHICRAIPTYQLHLDELFSVGEADTTAEAAFQDHEATNSYVAADNTSEECIGKGGDEIDTYLELPIEFPGIQLALQGVLDLRLYPGPPNYHSVEDGDYPEYCWILKLDSSSTESAYSAKELLKLGLKLGNIDEITVGRGDKDEEWLSQHIGQKVECKGYLYHAITSHHHTPVLMNVDNMQSCE